MELVFHDPCRFDVIHFHCDYVQFPFLRRHPCPNVTTLHGRLHEPDLHQLFRHYSEMPLVSISTSQRRPLPWANWQATVYHGIPRDLHTLRAAQGKYLAFLGRISPQKRLDWAIEIARGAGIPLKVAVKVDKEDQAYYHTVIEPMLRDHQSLVEMIGEVGGQTKDEFLGNALALLFPIDWEEPFGLVMIEAMACGTPVIAFRRGSVPEVMADGVTGYVVDNVDQAVQAVGKLDTISREDCRQFFESHFDAARMANDYLEVYRRLVQDGVPTNRPAPADIRSMPLPEPNGGRPCRLPTPLFGAAPAGLRDSPSQVSPSLAKRGRAS
jgi:glycosyltransferase involved in cell wall biosynthesis